MVISSGENRHPGELDDFQGSPSPYSGMVHLDEKQVKKGWQKTCKDK